MYLSASITGLLMETWFFFVVLHLVEIIFIFSTCMIALYGFLQSFWIHDEHRQQHLLALSNDDEIKRPDDLDI